MKRSSFLEKLSTMTHDQINQFIKDHGKRKETNVNLPFYIDDSKIINYNTINKGIMKSLSK